MARGSYNGGSTIIHAGSGWFGKGSATSQKSEKRKTSPKLQKSGKAKKKNGAGPSGSKKSAKGNGLTIPEQIARATKRVASIEQEIVVAKRKLNALEAQLVAAKSNVERVQNLPRRSAVGAALETALKAKSQSSRVD